jgi:hypothetical protein
VPPAGSASRRPSSTATTGPTASAEDRGAIERYGLVDTGIAYEVAVSGSIAWRAPAMRQVVDDARAGRFEVLVVGYSDRWQRNLRRTLEVLEDELHPAGVAVLFADVRILSLRPLRLGRARRRVGRGRALHPEARRPDH